MRQLKNMRTVLVWMLFLWTAVAPAQQSKKILILVEGKTDLQGFPFGDGRQLATLLGHFHAMGTVQGVDEYVPHSLPNYDVVFYVGYSAQNHVPQKFLNDVMNTPVPLVWLHTGFAEFSSSNDVAKRFGFTVLHLDSTGGYNRIEHEGAVFTKDEPIINLVSIRDRARVRVLATAVSGRTGHRIPYVVQSGNLLYWADSPFASSGPTDRYLLFADMLHDILQEQHEEFHSAILRIEDVNPMENPDRLRDVADILSARGIPFLVGVSPFYVNPGEGVRVSLSEKPDVVDALKYMVRNGGTVVMHGVTHQYKGVTGSDYEFWDESTNRPIRGETDEVVRRKIELGIQEFMKNGLYPLIWETPHYTASFRLYRIIPEYFSAAMEQRLALENADYSQFFPYIIHRDLFGQRIYPENLGYVPLLPDFNESRTYVQAIIRGARASLSVRDGFAACFFHAFVDSRLLEELVDSVQALGYTYIDLRDDTTSVKTRDRAILTGSQSYTVTLADQYLSESYFDRNGEIIRRDVSKNRLSGPVTRTVELESGELYKAEPTEVKETRQTFMQQAVGAVERLVGHLSSSEETWQEACPVILWNQYVRGAAYNDQASMAAVFGSVSIAVDTIFVGEPLDLSRHNLVLVPFAFVDSLRMDDYAALVRYVREGGHLITDTKNYLIDDFGVQFGATTLKVSRVLDAYFPEERIAWRYPELMTKMEADDVDEVFCTDNATGAPLVIGKRVGKGQIIFIATRFDPYSQQGYSLYPYLMAYVRKYFQLAPVVRQDALEMYFEPGFRHTQSIEYLVRQWVQQGIRRIHVAGWHKYPKYTYDYKRLVNLAHANGILVYAWLEPPQVSQKFWQDHPEWREKNYKGEDVRPSWRFPVALTDDRCLTALTEEYATFLEAFDWDGVNLAELYFEAGRGFDDPHLFTPMHESARKEFRWRYGIDLRAIFTPQSAVYWKTHPGVRNTVTTYRVAKLEEIYRRLLHRFGDIAQHRSGFEIIVTAMDSYGSPELRETIGVDMKSILRLQREFGFALQVEDPEVRWSTDPTRYVAMGARYAKEMGGPQKLLLDLNILSFRKQEAVTPFPTLTQTGTESFQMVRSASLGAPRSTIYAESSVNPQDMIFLANAYAGRVHYDRTGEGYSVDAPHSFTLRLPIEVNEILLDGVPASPVRDNRFTIPAGRHVVIPVRTVSGGLSSTQFYPRLLSTTGSLLTCEYTMRSMTFTYETNGRCIVMVNREPREVLVDGERLTFYSMKGNDGYSLFLPAGRHRAEITAGDPFSYGINIASIWSSNAIAVFGVAAVVFLLGMYAVVRLQRRRFGLERT
jgi:uncharacterized protein YdaL